MIVVTGATGQLGRRIVSELLARMPAERIGATTRDPDKAKDFAEAGVRVRRGDFADPASLPHAFEGAEQVLVVSSNAAAYGGDTMAQHRAAVAAAREAGARRVVYTSHMGASARSAFPPMRGHTATEALLADSGVAWTALRNGFYAGSGADLVGDVRESGAITLPADGKVSWTAHADLAAAAAVVLTEEGHFDGPTPPLTADTAVDLADLAAIAADLIGRDVRRSVVSDEAFERGALARGVPPSYAAVQLGLFKAARAGEFSATDPTLRSLIGRAPVSMREILAERLAA